jgi:hypothetical protein
MFDRFFDWLYRLFPATREATPTIMLSAEGFAIMEEGKEVARVVRDQGNLRFQGRSVYL